MERSLWIPPPDKITLVIRLNWGFSAWPHMSLALIHSWLLCTNAVSCLVMAFVSWRFYLKQCCICSVSFRYYFIHTQRRPIKLTSKLSVCTCDNPSVWSQVYFRSAQVTNQAQFRRWNMLCCRVTWLPCVNSRWKRMPASRWMLKCWPKFQSSPHLIRGDN